MNRVTIEQIEGEIASEHFFTAAQGVSGAGCEAGQSLDECAPMIDDTLRLLTICVLVLRNGIKVVGTSACVDPAIFDAEIGRKLARQDAVRQVWPLLGYELATRLAREAMQGCSDAAQKAGVIISFEALIEWARKQPGVNLNDGMPWSFTYQGLAVTHERDDLYLVNGMQLRPGDDLIIDADGTVAIDDHLPF